jgi:hypothetical protein
VINTLPTRHLNATVTSERHSMAGHAAGLSGTEAIKRLETEAHHREISTPFAEVVEKLVSMIGRRLTAYVASVKDARAVDRWLSGIEPQSSVVSRLRLAYRVALVLSSGDSPAVVKNWLTGLNPELDDAVPIALLRDGDIGSDGKKVLGAAMAFVLGG